MSDYSNAGSYDATKFTQESLQYLIQQIKLLATPHGTVDVASKMAVSGEAVAKALAGMAIPTRYDFEDNAASGISIPVQDYVYPISDTEVALDVRFVPKTEQIYYDNNNLGSLLISVINGTNVMRPLYSGIRYTIKGLNEDWSNLGESMVCLHTFFPHSPVVSGDDRYSFTELYRWARLVKNSSSGKYELALSPLKRSYINSANNATMDSSADTYKIRIDCDPTENEIEKCGIKALELYKMPYNMV